MKIRFLFLIFLSLSFLTIVVAQEQKMSANEVSKFQDVMRKTVQIKTLIADFVQYKKVGYVKKELVSSGKFYVKNPDKLAWFYTSPTAYTMVFNNKKMTIEEKGKKKAMDLSRNRQFEKISQAIQGSMSGAIYEDAEFSASYFRTTKQYILKLDPLPKELKKSIKQLVLHFDKSTNQVSEVRLMDNSNGSTRFVFTNHKVNSTLADSVFDL
ncbi:MULTISPECIES: LolA family protein [Sphingobacterium]|uniref:LolA family protein n=1 Tax=Sphingobacterium TaxID=28453 RepID=UPI0013D8FE81|nr:MULTISPECIES: outer membrane lipoprotein carrier protein LolA [unclassified Sphingobacterium]